MSDPVLALLATIADHEQAGAAAEASDPREAERAYAAGDAGRNRVARVTPTTPDGALALLACVEWCCRGFYLPASQAAYEAHAGTIVRVIGRGLRPADLPALRSATGDLLAAALADGADDVVSCIQGVRAWALRPRLALTERGRA